VHETQENVNKELEAFIDYLDAERDHVLGILNGLSDQDLRRPVLPSGWNCLEMVRHLTVDVERFWFRGVVAGEAEVADLFKAGATAHWHVPDGMSANEVFVDYRSETARANAVLIAVADTDHALDQEPAVWPVEIWPNWRLPDVRNILLHVVTELACHAGHLDAAREMIDGKTWSDKDPYTN
jgi:Protein of unknown function (DUF664)